MGLRNWLGKMFDPNKAADELAMKMVVKGGFLGERVDVVEEIGKPDAEVWGGKHNKITLPWLDIGNKRDNFDRVDAFQDLLNIKEWLDDNPNKNQGITDASAKLNRINRLCGTLIVGFSMTDPEDMKNIILNKPYIIDTTGSQKFWDPSTGRQGGEKSAGLGSTVRKQDG